ncbi:endogenous retrovirus group K member 5 Gag polyprotein-like [Vidua macroura]|uniref:endogenous retrovirus group K member 5 Gag polyprotein-like n=1 Tax=Vidua macroura TaxID=187451 RepID=UPI0023A8ACC7|nr:endogenous retrovirus group K member 5 Gag polyprotein-like [Vidua macroura]
MRGSCVFSSTADTSFSSASTQPSSLQMPQMLWMLVSSAAPKHQSQQMTPLYRQVPTKLLVLVSAKLGWQDIQAELEKEKGLLQGLGNIMMPVNYDAQGQNPRWERLDRGAIKDLAKAIRDNGLSSPYFKQMLKSIFGMYDLTPYDLKYLATSVLTDTQALVWQKAWRRSLEELRARYQGGPNVNLTMVQLAGDPPEDDPTQQAVRLPRNVLSNMKEAARRAILQIAPEGVQDNIYTEIKQGPLEPFSSFVDRLSQAVERQVINEGAKPHLIKSLAFSNDNTECRQIISMMPHQTILADMIEACNKVGTPQHVASIMKEQLGERIEKRVTEALANYTKSNSSAER